MVRSIGFILLALFILLTTTAGIGWYLLEDEAFLKSQASNWAFRYTGRQLTFNGPLSLQLGSVASLEARDIYVSNADWAQHPEMVSVGHILIKFEMASLLGETPTIPNALLEDCSLNLEKSETGEANWNLGPESEPESESRPEDQGKGHLPVWVKDLIIRNCQLEFSSFKLEQPLALHISEWAMQLSEENRWRGAGAGSLNDLPLSLNGSVAPQSNRYAVVCKSPLTGGIGNATCGGTYAYGMKRAGIDVVVVSHQSERPVRIEVNGDRDEVKFVIGSEEDYLWAGEKIREYGLSERCRAVLLSPVFGKVEPASIVDWMIRDKLDARFQLQMHKFIWAPTARSV